MKIFKILLVLASLTFATSSFSATWIAMCKDGQRLQYNQTLNGNGFLYLKGINANNGGIQVARLKQTFYNGTAICGTVLKNGYPILSSLFF